MDVALCFFMFPKFIFGLPILKTLGLKMLFLKNIFGKHFIVKIILYKYKIKNRKYNKKILIIDS